MQLRHETGLTGIEHERAGCDQRGHRAQWQRPTPLVMPDGRDGTSSNRHTPCDGYERRKAHPIGVSHDQSPHMPYSVHERSRSTSAGSFMSRSRSLAYTDNGMAKTTVRPAAHPSARMHQHLPFPLPMRTISVRLPCAASSSRSRRLFTIMTLTDSRPQITEPATPSR